MKNSFANLLIDAKKVGYLSDNVTDDTQMSGIQYCEFLGTLPFWCNDVTLHKKNPDYTHTAKCCVTHIVGLPRHPATNEEMPLTPYQIDVVNQILKNKYDKIKSGKLAEDILQELLRQYFFYHINKGRQMGFTEIMLRLIQFLCFSIYAGSNIGVMAATNGNLARKDLRRFARLFLNIKPVVEQWIKSGVMRLVNGCVIEAFAASEEAITGDTKYKCILMDEAAKWRTVNDTPVFNSVEPIIRASGGDLFLVSTPKSPIKMFYKITINKNEYIQLQYDIWHALDNLYTRKQIEQMLASATGDPNQEYLCIFTIGEGSIYGQLTELDRQGKEEWIVEDKEDDSDTDHYDEEKDIDEIHWHEK
jgi:hypothetical protein